MSRLPIAFALAALLGFGSAGALACATETAVTAPSATLPDHGADQAANTPGIERVVGPVRGSACSHRYDTAKAQAEALKQLQARAVARGGNGVTAVQFMQVTNTRSPCWHGVEATGLAVIYAR
jgi:hypothetical protein